VYVTGGRRTDRGCYNDSLLLLPADTPIHAAGRWFLQSGIQEPCGGVARYFRSDTGWNANISTEITGYGVSALLFLHARTGEPAYLDAALRAARFLTRIAWDAQLCAFPFEHSSNGSEPAAFTYFFDCGIVVRGLLAAWRATGETEFRDVAIGSGRAMLADFRQRDSIHPILSLPEKIPQPSQPRWSHLPGCYQLKSALAWRELFHTTGEAEFSRAFESALNTAMASAHDFLPGDANREIVMDRLHAYEYFLEGMVPALDRPECARLFGDGLTRVARYVDEIAPLFARTDVYAQLLRGRLLGEALGGIALDSGRAHEEARAIAELQIDSQETRVQGAFAFGRKEGREMPFANPVSTAFALQALAWWDDWQRRAARPTLETLI